jgi:hypothetical protein
MTEDSAGDRRGIDVAIIGAGIVGLAAALTRFCDQRGTCYTAACHYRDRWSRLAYGCARCLS